VVRLAVVVLLVPVVPGQVLEKEMNLLGQIYTELGCVAMEFSAILISQFVSSSKLPYHLFVSFRMR
jgi:hypothetical protein